jgi:hypothetical protein
VSDDKPLLAAEVLGFRGWRVSPSGLLMSASADDGWVPGDNAAICPRGLHPAPTAGCQCGLYAHFELDQVPASVNFGNGVGGIVIGAVAGWGRVILHPDGWRAENAKVISLFQRGPAESLERAQALYKVPIVAGPWELPADCGAEEVPKHMRPEEEPGTSTGIAAGLGQAPMSASMLHRVATHMPPPGSSHHGV